MTQKQCPKCSARYMEDTDVCEDDGIKLVDAVPSMGSAGSPYIDFVPVGKGLWGEVFKAKHATLNYPVGIKILHSHFAKRGADVKRVVRDGQLLSQIENANVAKVYEAGFINEHQPYIVTEYLEAQTLSDFLDAGLAIPERVSISVFKQCAKALVCMEPHKIVHGDLTPTNIVGDFSSEDGTVKVADFIPGNLFAYELKEQRILAGVRSVTAYSYISPEQWKGKKLDVRSDIYSLGCVMYKTLVGHCPFEGLEPAEVMALQSTSAPTNIVETSACVSPALASIVMRCLQKKPGDRFQTGAELLRALERAQQVPTQVPWGKSIKIPTVPKKIIAVVATVVISAAAVFEIAHLVINSSNPEQRWRNAMRSSLQEMRTGNLNGARRHIDEALASVATTSSPLNLQVTHAYDAVLARLQGNRKREKMYDNELAGAESKTSVPVVTSQADAVDLDAILASFSSASDTTDKTNMLSLANQFNADCLRRGPLTQQRELLRAVPLFGRVLGSHCNEYGDAQYELGLSFEEQFTSAQHTQNAIASLTAALDAYKTSTPLDQKRICNGHEHLGIALGRLADFSAAETQFREALKICDANPTMEVQRSNIARLLSMTLRIENKIAALNQATATELDRALRTGSYASAWESLSLNVDSAFENQRLDELNSFLKSKLSTLDGSPMMNVPRGLCLSALCKIAILQDLLPDAQKYAEQACDALQLGELPQSRLTSGLALPQLLSLAALQLQSAKAIPAAEELVAISERSTTPPSACTPFTANYLLAETWLLAKDQVRSGPAVERVHKLLASGSDVGVGGVMTTGFDANGRSILGDYGMSKLLLYAKRDYDATFGERFGLFRTKAALCMADYIRLLRLSTGEENFDVTTTGQIKRKAGAVAVELTALLSKAKHMEPFKRAYCYSELSKYHDWNDEQPLKDKNLALSHGVLPLSPDRSFPDGITP